MTKREHKQLKVMAKLYAYGDVSKWIRHCIDDYNPAFIKKATRVKSRRPKLQKKAVA